MSEQTSLAESRVSLGSLTFGADWAGLLDASRVARIDHPQAWEPEYYEARALVESGRYEDAQHLLLLAMDRFPGNAMLAVLYGQIADQGPDHDAAIARWKLMLQRLPHTTQLHLGLATALCGAGLLNEAAEAYAAGMARAPDNVQLAAGRAQLDLRQQDWLAALHSWAAVGDLRPDHPDVVGNMVLALRRLGKLDEADLLAREAISESPDDVALCASYAETAVLRGDFTEAVPRWAAVLALAPNSVPGALGLADAYRRTGNIGAATQVLKTALMLHPREELLLTSYATLATLDRQWPEAVARWQEVHRQCRPRAGMYVSYIDALAQSDRFEEADVVAAEALDFAPGEEVLLQRYAQIAVRRGAYGDALHRWHQAERHFPHSPLVIDGIHVARAALHQIGGPPADADPPPPDAPAITTAAAAPDHAPAILAEPPPQTPVLPRPPPPEPSVLPVWVDRLPAPPPPAAPVPIPRETPAWAIRHPDPEGQMPQIGVTALDLLMGGQADAAASPPAPRPAAGLAGKLRKIFGKND